MVLKIVQHIYSNAHKKLKLLEASSKKQQKATTTTTTSLYTIYVNGF